jgi:hypothetical protein
MMKNHLSIIFLPTNKCNVNCEYCFEDKTDDRLSLSKLSFVTNKIFDARDLKSASSQSPIVVGFVVCAILIGHRLAVHRRSCARRSAPRLDRFS